MSDSPLELLYRAYRAELGIVVETSDPERLRQKLYAERRKDPDLACLTIRISPYNPDGEIFIVRRPDGSTS